MREVTTITGTDQWTIVAKQFFAEVWTKFAFVVNTVPAFLKFSTLGNLIKNLPMLDQSGQLISLFHLAEFQNALDWTKVANLIFNPNTGRFSKIH